MNSHVHLQGGLRVRVRVIHLQGGLRVRVIHLQGGLRVRVIHLQGGLRSTVLPRPCRYHASPQARTP
jgi:hypothetical protein